jgi:hypothetical protein
MFMVSSADTLLETKGDGGLSSRLWKLRYRAVTLLEKSEKETIYILVIGSVYTESVPS